MDGISVRISDKNALCVLTNTLKYETILASTNWQAERGSNSSAMRPLHERDL